jgi:hypothetical protein
MSRGISRLFAFALALGLASVAAGHHPPKMERCVSVEFTGRIERIEWRMPHVELLIRTDDGESHRVSWLSINQLTLAGINRDTLHVGEEVVVTAGVRPDDVVERPMLLGYIHRTSDDWGWSQTPQGC